MHDERWTLLGADGSLYHSDCPAELGGYRPGKLYGRLDCRSALAAIERGGYTKQRVFFLNEPAAIAAGYRPCSVCMPQQYATWKAARHGAGTFLTTK